MSIYENLDLLNSKKPDSVEKTDSALLYFLVRGLNLLAIRADTSENKKAQLR